MRKLPRIHRGDDIPLQTESSPLYTPELIEDSRGKVADNGVKGTKGDRMHKEKSWTNLKRIPLRRSERQPRKSSRLMEGDGGEG